MRPRFSLRWILVSFAFFAALLYFGFARPTVIANRLVAEIKQGNFSEIEGYEVWAGVATASKSPTSLMHFLKNWANAGRPIEVSIEPRTWEDIWLWRRRLKLVGGFEIIETIDQGKQFTNLQNVTERHLFRTTFVISTGLNGPRIINQSSQLMGNNQ